MGRDVGSPTLLSESCGPALTFLPANVAQDKGGTAEPHLHPPTAKLRKNLTNVSALANYLCSQGLLENFGGIFCQFKPMY